ncbi:winged helix DNA-binding domain-containing protein [Pedobacter hiemivivus]|uniref:Winged helix DNA-binding domain-containing protein n=1 Tax=Pedobacter hiemivivus TaxID=2530454 RepID=A0A4R0N8Z3_9SPHI|nr:winged helix DNA-binding domain-containing protein [Pedobacter hiemivivus]TCC96638.1 winged helix DNA-binding domain-containing protein [Pedobacter hiemivivus]
MTKAALLNHRLVNQQISETVFKTPQEIVSWMVAMQAQEYAMSKWAIALRLKGVTEQDVEKAFNEGLILRTHLLRPTWHFVTPTDIRWLIGLTAPRVEAVMAFYNRELGLERNLFNKCNNLITKALEGGKHLTRAAIAAELLRSDIPLNGRQIGHVMMQAELDCIVCSGARQGKQFTYALFDERVPAAKPMPREEALALLAHKYFSSRGPATIKDFSVWSGLTLTEAKKGAASMSSSAFFEETFEGKTYILPFENPSGIFNRAVTSLSKSFLMPDYDEYGMGYIDRSAIFNPIKITPDFKRNNPVFNRMIIIDGIIEGTWQRTLKGKSLVVETFPFHTLNKIQSSALSKAVERFVNFAEHKW